MGLQVVTRRLHRVAGEAVDPRHGSLSGLLATLNLELPWLRAGVLDIADEAVDDLLPVLTAPVQPELALREGQAHVPLLERVELAALPSTALARGGSYVVSGGLGGIGRHLVRWLLERHGARVLVVGRRPIDPGELAEFEGLGELRYVQANVADTAALRAAAADFGRLDGAFHLAGSYDERPLLEETPERLRAALRPKALGAMALRQLLAEQGGEQPLLVLFGSVLGDFGAADAGAYAAANSALRALSEADDAVDVRCLAWSNWDDTGMSAGLSVRAAVEARGFVFLSPEQALQHLEAVLTRPREQLLIGLDSRRPLIRRQLDEADLSLQRLVAWSEVPSSVPCPADRYGNATGDAVRIGRLPRTATGEIDRAALSASAAGFEEPRTELERALAEVWQDVLGLNRIGRQDNFFLLGGNSLKAVALVGRIQSRLDRVLPLHRLFEAPTIASQAAALDAVPSWSPLVPLQPEGVGAPLFIVHPGSGGALVYLGLVQRLGAARPVIGLQARGLDPGQQPIETLDEMVEAYVAAIRSVQAEGPYYIAGWSFGGVVAYEIARRLQAAGAEIGRLAVLDISPLETDPTKRAETEVADEVTLLQNIFPALKPHAEMLRALPEAERYARVLAEGRANGTLPPHVGPAHLRAFLRVSRACGRIRLEGLPAGSRFTGTIDLLTSAESRREHGESTELGWTDWTSDGVRVHHVGGEHVKMMDEPTVDEVAVILRELLA